jgi:eukaryotic-like serine/threonine-protein kinase
MEFNLIVLQGPEAGRAHHTIVDEADNILVGREDVESKANIRLSKDDQHVSRSQFLLEVRPPNVLLRDPCSANGTHLRRDEADWQLVDEILLQDGDLIKVGNTVLRYERIEKPQSASIAGVIPGTVNSMPLKTGPAEAKPIAVPAEPDTVEPALPVIEPRAVAHPDEEQYCIRCGEKLAHLPGLDKPEIRDLDFMCPDCQGEVAAQRQAQSARQPRLRISCSSCGADVSQAADHDQRAADLQGVVSYLCKVCAQKALGAKPQVIGDFLIMKELGRGGMGVVYRAWQQKTWRVVALKLMLPAVQLEEIPYQRFQREMSIMQELNHPNLVRLISAGQETGAPYFVSELANGGNLDQFISPQGLPELPAQEIAQIIAGALHGLQYLHQSGYVHRDLKPENILIQRMDGKRIPKLVDFGLARSYEKYGGTVSRTGECAGTLMYMPPEQITQFKRCRPPVDIYAMGVTLYYLLTGYYSLEFPTPREVQRRKGNLRLEKDPVRMILDDRPVPIQARRKDLPPQLCEVVDKAVRKKAIERYQTAESFRQALLASIGA